MHYRNDWMPSGMNGSKRPNKTQKSKGGAKINELLTKLNKMRAIDDKAKRQPQNNNKSEEEDEEAMFTAAQAVPRCRSRSRFFTRNYD